MKRKLNAIESHSWQNEFINIDSKWICNRKTYFKMPLDFECTPTGNHVVPTHKHILWNKCRNQRKKIIIFLFTVRARNKCELIKRCNATAMCYNLVLLINKFSFFILFHFSWVCISFDGISVCIFHSICKELL